MRKALSLPSALPSTPAGLAPTESQSIGRNHVGEIEIALDRPIARRSYESNPVTGRVVLEYDGRIAGGGLLLEIDSRAAIAAAPASDRVSHIIYGELRSQAACLAAALADLSPAQRIARLRRRSKARSPSPPASTRGPGHPALAQLSASRHRRGDPRHRPPVPETYELWPKPSAAMACASGRFIRLRPSWKSSSEARHQRIL